MNAVHQLLTDHIDIWTAADTEKKSGRGRASGNAGRVYGIRKLRELILELAVRGKLVPQDVSDEPASELIKRIQIEKSMLLAEGKVKKSKILPAITDKEKPFEIPQGWEWIRLGEVLEMVNGRAFKPTDWIAEGLPIVRIQNLNNSEAEFNYCDNQFVDDRHVINSGSFLISWSGTPGTSFGAFIWNRGKAALNQHIFSCFQIGKPFFDRFLELAINTRLEELIAKAHGGVGLQHVTKGKLEALTLVLPSTEEQHRIVAKVDELMALCDQLESQHINAVDAHEKLVSHLLGTLTLSKNAEDFSTNWQRIAANFDTLFTTEVSIDALKQTLLQLAVMGKLVPQDPSDEPASELLKRIQAEKTKLIAEGKIKKENSFPAIEDEEKPFALPQNWTWVRLVEIIKISSGDGLTSDQMTKSGEIPVYGGNGVNGYHDIANINKRTLVIGRVGYYCGSVHITPDAAWVTDNAFITQFSENNISLDFLYWLLRKTNLKENESATAQPVISGRKVYPIVVALPPLFEQHRIIATINELMALCDHLKSRIISTNQLQQKLADVMVEKAVAQP